MVKVLIETNVFKRARINKASLTADELSNHMKELKKIQNDKQYAKTSEERLTQSQYNTQVKRYGVDICEAVLKDCDGNYKLAVAKLKRGFNGGDFKLVMHTERENINTCKSMIMI